ncbi:unnamed protein product [Schistosoma mattheei]|uniref:Uncharacterized protein n=1 Tax=Schistosoma mattheei TaxID=31246 RepID=A0A183P372_9TREM|nr:unnamed protein product [Schistosoma mattheei]
MPYGGAQLKIEWDYNNPASLLENGQICDRVGGKECDVYFTLCLKNAASVTDDIDKCHLLQHTTRIFDNAGYLEFRGSDGIEIFVPQPVPVSYLPFILLLNVKSFFSRFYLKSYNVLSNFLF